YNSGKTNKTVSLDGTYVDVKNKQYSGNVTLAPFSSLVLIRKELQAERPTPAPTVEIVSPKNNESYSADSEIKISAAANSSKGKVNKVEFYNGNVLLGTATSAPFHFPLKNAKPGKYTISAKATDDQGLSTSSQEITFTVAAKKDDVQKAPAAPATPVAPAFALHLNTGTDKDVTLGGVVFKGDRNFKDYFNASHEANNPAASKDQLYQTERNAHSLSYAIPVPNGVYSVKTYHNEQYWGKGGPAASKGRRVFDISL